MLKSPANAELRDRLVVFRGDLLKTLVRENSSASKRTPGLDQNVGLFSVFDRVELRITGMEFNLIDRGKDFSVVKKLFDMRLKKVT